MKKAFTLAELMIALVVTGVLSAVLIPAVVEIPVNQNKIMFKKAYYSSERVVSELINDDKLYPLSDTLVGFLNTVAATIGGTTYSTPATKFCNLFVEKINISGTANCSTSQTVTTGNSNLGTGNFRTNDGMTWYVPVSAFTTGTDGEIETIIVDVNGTSTYNEKKSPNCLYNASTCPSPDQFTIKVRNDGKLIIDGTKEMEYLQNTKIGG